ncbi:MAG: GHKL domain-containing protein [Bdellovibrionales bacterium]|nr:GHKL domain-containing protein [Bdellovibrionales bacterium]
MRKLSFMERIRASDLQAKVGLILLVVIFPISILVGLLQSKVLEPILAEEVQQVGVSFAQNLASYIETHKLLTKPNATFLIEDQIKSMVYAQPSIIRVDVIALDPKTKRLQYIASNVEEQETVAPPIEALHDKTVIEVGKEEGIPVWEIYYPIKVGAEKANIRILSSLRFVGAIQSTTLKINLLAALMSTIVLILILNFFLRRLIENEKQLKVAQRSNEALSEKLQEIQQELIHTEKLAVMGQLTASFAHEIGTPLNALGGHLQLLNMDLEKAAAPSAAASVQSRMGIITGQLKKIEDIVKQFLQTTKKPIAQQKSVVPMREMVERILALVLPTLQRNQISFGQEFLASSDLVEVVPLEIEQVILNLINNAIDSMREKTRESKGDGAPNALWVSTRSDPKTKNITLEIKDTGTGISGENLKQIFKPFFTTKSAGEGHGLGLSICQQIIRSYGGEIIVESKPGRGTQMKVQLPMVAGAKS